MKKTFAIITAAATIFFGGCTVNELDKDKQVGTAETSIPDEAVQPFKDYFNGFFSNDGEKIIFSTTPQSYIDEMKKTDKYEQLLTQTTDTVIAYTLQAWEKSYGEDLSVTYLETSDFSQLEADKLELAELCYKLSYYDVNAELEITDGYEVRYRYRISGSENSEESEQTCCFVKVENDGWKMISLTADELEQFRGADSLSDLTES